MTAGIPINPQILKQCRLQIGLDDINEAAKVTEVDRLATFEEGGANPTYKQIQKIAEAYCVPAWIFNDTATEIPKEYNFYNEYNAVFRSLDIAKVKHNYKINKFINHVMSRRKFLLEIYEDDDDRDVPEFNPPTNIDTNPIKLADKAHSWLGINMAKHVAGKSENNTYAYYKECIEEKGILVFMTSSTTHWSKIEPEIMRGLALYEDILPIIVVNGKDSIGAKTFTLIHELGHILRQDTTLDDESNIGNSHNTDKSEVFCNQFAANLLMPNEQFTRAISGHNITADIPSGSKKLEKLGKGFGVSKWAIAVRMRTLDKISESYYQELVDFWEEEYKNRRKEFKEKKRGIPTNAPKERINRYGKTYISSIFQLYHNDEISLVKLCNILDIKKTKYVHDIEEML